MVREGNAGDRSDGDRKERAMVGERGRADTYDPASREFELKQPKLRTLQTAYGAVFGFSVREGKHLDKDSRYPQI
jgi:hypothetical protein